jgi:hypothetical protein
MRTGRPFRAAESRRASSYIRAGRELEAAGVNRRACRPLSQTCGISIAMSKSTGISVPSLKQSAAGGTGNFEPGSVLFRD